VTTGASPQGYVLGTHTDLFDPAHGASRTAAHYLLSHQLKADFAVRGIDVWPPLVAGAPYVVVDWRALQACSSANGSIIAACGITPIVGPSGGLDAVTTLPRSPAGTDIFTPTLTLVIPVCPGAGAGGSGGRLGAALLGEPDKIASVSVQRFVSASCTPTGLSFVVAGQPGEAVTLAAVAFGAQTVSVLNATVPSAPGSTLSCSLDGSALQCVPQ
jgi:hypothetical protein